MALLELGGKRFPIPVGEIVLGSDATSAVQIEGEGVQPRHAVLQGMRDGQVVIRKAVPEALVLINGVRLGAEPTPLLHGDKLQLGGHELTFVDERRSGSTMNVPAMGGVPGVGGPGAPGAGSRGPSGEGPHGATGTTGGRVVCLTDGREYQVTGTSLVFGREAGCDVVVTGRDVSRRHAEIVATPRGYLLVDSSTNGTFVNEERVEGQRILVRGDVLRIGGESFRFHVEGPAQAAAPAAAAAAPRPPASVPPPPPAPPAPPPASRPPPGAGERLKDTGFGIPVAPRPPAGRPAASAQLATFLVRSGGLKGQRLAVRTPVVNIGRAEYNDVVLPDESVSTMHAKLQRREGVWVLVDLDSTNGTFVDGERTQGETPLAPGASVRFGDVQLVFDPTDDTVEAGTGGGTRVLGAMRPEEGPPAPAPSAAPAARPPVSGSRPAVPGARPSASGPRPAVGGAAPGAPARPAPKRPAATAPAPAKKGKGCGASATVLVLGVAACAYWILT